MKYNYQPNFSLISKQFPGKQKYLQAVCSQTIYKKKDLSLTCLQGS